MKIFFKRMKKLLIILFVLSTLSSCVEVQNKSPEKSTFIMSDKMLQGSATATARKQYVKNQLNFYGKIMADNNKLIEIFPVVGGNVTNVYVELGDYVEKGQLLAIIRSTEVAGFEKEMEDAQSDLLVAKNNMKVAKDLYEGKLNTESSLIEANREVEKAQSQLSRVKETYNIYSLRKGAVYEVRAPISGFIIQKNINSGMLLRSDKSDNIFDIAQIDDVWAIVNVNESDISEVKVGMAAEISTLSYPDKIFYGKVDKIYNIIDPETKAMKALVKLKNDGFLLKPDMRANIVLSYQEDKKMVAVPSSAIVFDNSKNYVVVFEDRNNIKTIPVEVYRQVHDTAYIVSGLEEGQKVLTKNQLLVYQALSE